MWSFCHFTSDQILTYFGWCSLDIGDFKTLPFLRNLPGHRPVESAFYLL